MIGDECRFAHPCTDPLCAFDCPDCIAFITGACMNPDHYELRA